MAAKIELKHKVHVLTRKEELDSVRVPGKVVGILDIIFGTTTKETGYGARGTDMLRLIRNADKIPIVAIGGIKEGNVTQVWEAGADSAAIISDILVANEIDAKLERILGLAQARR